MGGVGSTAPTGPPPVDREDRGQNCDPSPLIGVILHLSGDLWEGVMYKKVLLAYDGSIEGRRSLREGAKLAQLCCSEVFLLAVVELSSIIAPEAGLAIPIDDQTANYKAILAEGV